MPKVFSFFHNNHSDKELTYTTGDLTVQDNDPKYQIAISWTIMGARYYHKMSLLNGSPIFCSTSTMLSVQNVITSGTLVGHKLAPEGLKVVLRYTSISEYPQLYIILRGNSLLQERWACIIIKFSKV